jgi:hypothetical protein
VRSEDDADARVGLLAALLQFPDGRYVCDDAVEDERGAGLDASFALEALRVTSLRRKALLDFSED